MHTYCESCGTGVMSTEIKKKIGDLFSKIFQDKFLKKRFDKDYAYSVLKYRRRSKFHKGNRIAMKKGTTRDMVLSTFSITPTGFTFKAPNYTKAKRWKVPTFIRDSKLNEFIANIIEKVTAMSFKQTFDLVKAVVPDRKKAYVISRRLFNTINKPK